MRRTSLSIPEVMMIAGTRVALGVGIGLMIADRISRDARKGAALALLGVGAISTIPLVFEVLGSRVEEEELDSAAV